ncbi:hypothetical protein GCM10022403_067660 [Streptomyces coacervatus]|uniref:HTH marR-type domain-containing protein n=1 Tax=Streptomyces coacervatus TaxID=647381 RepID=A0ABP7IR68_9ACTN|nr:MarR family transcriptional regulator [Streptomyces coacervatus]MDF2266810.1 MarR family transcriptional regulator [Streptomyces coacervatus]
MPQAHSVTDPPPANAAPPAHDRSDTELRYLLLAAQREGARAMSAQLRRLNLTPAQAEILLVLSQRAPLTLAEVGRLIVCENHSPSRIVDTLVKRGLLYREPGQIDRRVIYLQLSPQGEELLPELQQIDAAVDAIAAEQLSAQEKEVMIGALHKIIAGSPSAATMAQRFPR